MPEWHIFWIISKVDAKFYWCEINTALNKTFFHHGNKWNICYANGRKDESIPIYSVCNGAGCWLECEDLMEMNSNEMCCDSWGFTSSSPIKVKIKLKKFYLSTGRRLNRGANWFLLDVLVIFSPPEQYLRQRVKSFDSNLFTAAFMMLQRRFVYFLSTIEFIIRSNKAPLLS